MGVVKPTRRPLDVMLSFTGDVFPNRQTPIFAKTSGCIRAIHVERGQYVKAGALLVEIEPTEMENALDQSRAALASAEASLQVARSNLDAAKANLLNQQALLTKAQAVLANDRRQADRLSELFAKGLVAAQDRDNARTSYEASQAALSAQQAQVETARVQIATTDSQVQLAEDPDRAAAVRPSAWRRCVWTTRGSSRPSADTSPSATWRWARPSATRPPRPATPRSGS